MTTEVTRYQLCLEYFRLILKIKNQASRETYLKIVDEAVHGVRDKNVSEEDIEAFTDFLENLNETSFQDDCMTMYLRLKKYDNGNEKFFPSLEFLKIRLYEHCLTQQSLQM